MANLVLGSANGNFATAGTWNLAPTLAFSTAFQTALATSFSYTATGHVLAASQINAISIQPFARVASPVGTFTIVMRNITLGTDIATTQTTINVSDLPVDSNGHHLILLATPFTPDGVTTYGIGVKCSTASEVTLQRASNNEWSRLYRQSAASGAAPTTGDVVLSMGEYTGAGTSNSYTLTMDQNSANAIGDIHVCAKSTFSWKTTAITLLTTSGNLNIYAGSTYNKGTSVTPIGSNATTTTATLAFTGNSKALTINAGATYNEYGATITYTSTKLSATANSGQAVIVTVDSTGWDGFTWNATPQFLVAGTVSSSRQTEKMTLSSIATSTSITASGNYTNGHNGTMGVVFTVTSANATAGATYTNNGVTFTVGATIAGVTTLVTTAPTPFTPTGSGTLTKASGTGDATITFSAFSSNQDMRAHVILLNRNSITTWSGTAWSCSFATTATVNIQYAEFTKSGSGTITSTAQGCNINTSTGSFSMKYCSWHDLGLGSSAQVWNVGTLNNNIAIQGCLCHNTTNIASVGFAIGATSGTSWTLDSNFFVMMSTGGITISLGDIGGTVTNNVCIDCQTSTNAGALTITEIATAIGTFSGNLSYAGGGTGFLFQLGNPGAVGPFTRLLISGFSAWRNAGAGMVLGGQASDYQIDTFNAWGNSLGEMAGNAVATLAIGVLITNSTLDAGATQVSPSAFSLSSGCYWTADIVGTTFGSNQSYANVFGTTGTIGITEVNCYNCTMAGTAIVQSALISGMPFGSFIASHNDGNVSNAHIAYYRNGYIQRDTTNNEGGTNQCWTWYPNIAANATGNGLWRSWEMPVEANATAVFTMRMKKLASYNGNNPKLSIEYKGQLIVAEVAQTITTSYADYTITLPVSTVAQNTVVKVWMHVDGTNVASGQICVQAAGRTT